MNDNEIIDCLKGHDQERALRHLYQSIYPSIKRYIKEHGGTEDDAMDTFQDTLLSLHRIVNTREDFELKASLSTYLYMISKNIWLKTMRKKCYEPIALSSKEEMLPDEQALNFENTNLDADLVKNALEKLSEPCRQIIEKFYIEEKSFQQIANELGYENLNVMKVTKSRCLQRLREIILREELYKSINK